MTNFLSSLIRSFPRVGRPALVGAGCIVLASNAALAQTKTWTGSVSSNWNVAGNWAPAGVPGGADDVLIPASAGFVLIDSSVPTVHSVALASTLQLYYSNLTINGGGLSLDGGTVVITTPNNNGINFVSNAQSISGTGTVSFDDQGGFSNPHIRAFGVPVTIGAGVTCRSTSGEGEITTDTTGSVTVLGTVRASTGTIYLSGNITNYDSTTVALTGGTWWCDSGSISFSVPVPITSIGPGTTVKFGGGGFSYGVGLGQLAANLGTIQALSGADVTFAPGGGIFQNNGTVTLGTGSILHVNGEFRQTSPGALLDISLSSSLSQPAQAQVIAHGTNGSGNSPVRLGGTVRATFAGPILPDCNDTFDLVTGSTRNGTMFAGGQFVPAEVNGTLDAVGNGVVQLRVGGNCPVQHGCAGVDFNNDGLFPDTQDIEDFLRVFAGGPCSQ